MSKSRTRESVGNLRRIVPSAAAIGLGMSLLATSAHALIITEVMYNPVAFGSDDGQEWVELYNDGGVSILLDGYSLGWGGADYTMGTLDLTGAGTLNVGEYIVIGGPTSPFDFAPDLEDGFILADGVALFDAPAAAIPGRTPIDALIYSSFFGFNGSGLIDETGAAGAVDVTIAAAGESAALQADGSWSASTTPTPGAGLPIPEPRAALFLGLGLAALSRRPR